MIMTVYAHHRSIEGNDARNYVLFSYNNDYIRYVLHDVINVSPFHNMNILSRIRF